MYSQNPWRKEKYVLAFYNNLLKMLRERFLTSSVRNFAMQSNSLFVVLAPKFQKQPTRGSRSHALFHDSVGGYRQDKLPQKQSQRKPISGPDFAIDPQFESSILAPSICGVK
jgi:hypothetical protein